MLRFHDVRYLPVAPATDHAGHLPFGDPGVCQDRSPAQAWIAPFLCSRVTGHDGDHTAHARVSPAELKRLGWQPARPATPDVVLVLAEWDNDRATDGEVR